MHILTHRGYWKHPGEKNSRDALRTAFRCGLGAETDIRDLNGELVVSHDLPRTGALPLSYVLDDYAAAGQPVCLALNIKSDGLTDILKRMLSDRGISHYFCFDMSVPDTLPYLNADMSVAIRLSEYEVLSSLAVQAKTIWLDGFHSISISPEQLSIWLSAGKQVCLVSPELHRRSPAPLWKSLAELPSSLRDHPDLMLCTDLPEQAKEILL